MALEYELTLCGDIPVEMIARRAFPDESERPTGTPSLLSVALYEKLGFAVSVVSGTNGYVEGSADDGRWEWEPAKFVSLTFHMDKSANPHWKIANMIEVVRRVLDNGTEDAALTQNGDVLLLTRFDGVLVKHRREGWWDHYPAAGTALPG